MTILDDEFRTELASYAERMVAAERRGRERERQLARDRIAAGLPARFVAYGQSPADAMARVHNAGMPAHLIREYQQVITRREAD
ncbi:hypothetical protein [Streptomyces globisporus]|uniref:hypothetical protein n=1 Tax=Streptomyces globisporus TaxID=1908 RepID=UPI0033FE0253